MYIYICTHTNIYIVSCKVQCKTSVPTQYANTASAPTVSTFTYRANAANRRRHSVYECSKCAHTYCVYSVCECSECIPRYTWMQRVRLRSVQQVRLQLVRLLSVRIQRMSYPIYVNAASAHTQYATSAHTQYANATSVPTVRASTHCVSAASAPTDTPRMRTQRVCHSLSRAVGITCLAQRVEPTQVTSALHLHKTALHFRKRALHLRKRALHLCKRALGERVATNGRSAVASISRVNARWLSNHRL